jgi:RNA polymerase sigma-70 factor (TIGR02960 family)
VNELAVAVHERADLDAARRGDEAAFARLVEPHRRSLHALCYRMLGSVHDADDALQEALLGAWRGIARFEGRSSVRSWLHRIAVNASIRLSDQRRRRRVLPVEYAPARTSTRDIGEPATEAVYVGPYPDAALRDRTPDVDPAARYELLESVELAFVAALQELPASQRAVLVLRDVLAMPAAEVAEALDTSPAAVNSALQRARRTIGDRVGGPTQQATLRRLGDEGRRQLLQALVRAWQDHDVDSLVALLAEDARLTMPPFPAWYDGREMFARFFVERVFEHPWHLVPTTANGQLAIAAYLGEPGAAPPYPLALVAVVTVRGDRITSLDSFHLPEDLAPFGLPPEAP